MYKRRYFLLIAPELEITPLYSGTPITHLYNCVCIARVTPDKYPNSVSVTVLTAILQPELEITALLSVKAVVATVVVAPAIVACFVASNVLTSCLT